jgi:multiple sugar transport system permease protein
MKHSGQRFKRIFLYLWVGGFLTFFLFPFYWILNTSLQGKNSLFTKDVNFFPRDITLENYIPLFTHDELNIVTALLNSLKVDIVASLICIILGSLGAYAFARLRFKGSKVWFTLLLVTEMLPPISFLIPFFMLYSKLHLLNTWYGLVIGYVAWLLPIATWILYGYFKTIPRDLEDSARIDGSSRVGALLRIVIPVSIPGLISAGIVCFMFSMGEFIFAVSTMTQGKARTLPVEITLFIGKFSLDYGAVSATAILALIVPVILVLLLQRYLIEGLTKGAVKE